jgi:hypothetical protein
MTKSPAETFVLRPVSQRVEQKAVPPMSTDNRIQMHLKPVALCLFLIGLPLKSFCQQSTCPDTSTDRATVQTLMGEVRQLRMLIDKSAPIISRMSVVLMRFPRQDDKVERLSRELQDFRSQIAANTSSKEALMASIRELEAEPVPSDPAQRSELEMRKKMLAAQVQQLAASEQQYREQELELSSRLQKEQAILADLTEQLNAIDKKLQLSQ